MDVGAIGTLEQLISVPRFQTYLGHYRGNHHLAARLYAWNIEVSSAFWGPLSILEVALRNAMHNALSKGRPDTWWDLPSTHLMDNHRAILDETIAKLQRKIVTPSPGQIVAALPFGFWTRFLDKGIPRHPLLSYETAFWQPRLMNAFPEGVALKRKVLFADLTQIREMRNRIAHHEPIFKMPLETICGDISRIAGYIHVDAAAIMGGCSRVARVLDRKQDAIMHGRNSF
ncbi:hypothetical protein [Paenarthrobacter sp. NPDC090522]|uniref:hypothetical protein n=1 Tax=Paenarthrobacter sp. NPDC090522 TaxID=3364383 RepID=UPI0037F35690